MKHSPILVVGIALSMTGFARADTPTPAATAEPVCLIAGWENPASVCVAHNRTIAATCYICHGPNGISHSAVVMRYDPDKEAYIRQPGGGASEDSDDLNFEYNKTWLQHIWADTFA